LAYAAARKSRGGAIDLAIGAAGDQVPPSSPAAVAKGATPTKIADTALWEREI